MPVERVRHFEGLEPLPRHPRRLTDAQQRAVSAHFQLTDIKTKPTHNIDGRTTLGALLLQTQRDNKGLETRLQALVDAAQGDGEVQAEIKYQTEVRTRAQEALQLEKDAYEYGLIYMQIGSRRDIDDSAKVELQNDIKEDLTAWEERRNALLGEPVVFDRYRTAQLTGYKEQLASPDHYVELPSRLDYEREIISLWLNGQSVMVAGYTGTGKSETIKHAAQTISMLENGEPSRPVVIRASDEALMQDFMGDIQLVGGNTVYSRGPATQALISGQVVQLEEANLLPNERHLTLRDLLNRSAGDPIPLANTDPLSTEKIVYETVGNGYHFAASQNPKSEKYQRHETWAEVDRAYGHPRKQLYYMPPTEVYDLALASLLDSTGGIALSEADLIGTKQVDGSYNGTLVTFISLAQEFQNAYTGLIQSSNGLIRGSEQLDKLVVDPKTILDIVKGFPNRPNQTESFNEYISGQFLGEYINNPAYPANERLFVLRRMVQKGFFRGYSESDFEITGKGTTREDVLNALTGQIKSKDGYVYAYTSSDVIARLDPYGQLAQLRTNLNLTAYTTDEVASSSTKTAAAPTRVTPASAPMGLTPVTTSPAPTPSGRTKHAVKIETPDEEVDRTLRSGARKLRTKMLLTRTMRATPSPLSFPLPYGRDGVITIPNIVKEDHPIWATIIGLTSLPVNLVTYPPTFWHKRLFRRALEKRQMLMLDVLQRSTDPYPADVWASITKSYYDLKRLSDQSYRPRIDHYFSDPTSKSIGKWQWRLDESLSIVDMIVDRFPQLQNTDEIHEVWNAVFGRGALRRTPPEDETKPTEDPIKARFIRALYDVVLKTQDRKVKDTARKYLNMLASRTFGVATALEYFGDAQDVAAIQHEITR